MRDASMVMGDRYNWNFGGRDGGREGGRANDLIHGTS
jgi:hypothetical protein